MLRKILLGCGIVSSVLYIAGDVIGTRRYQGYTYADQNVSELRAAGAPTRPLMAALFIPYSVLVTALGAGVWASAAGRKRAARLTGALLAAYAVSGEVTGSLFPMTVRGTKGTRRNALHGPMTGVMSLFIVLAMGFGATLLGKRFRYYTYATMATLVVFGGLTSVQIGRLAANRPTPWMGIEERINIYSTMLWLAVLPTALLRADDAGAR